MNIEYRELTKNDIDELLIYEKHFPNPWSKEAFEVEFDSEFNKTLAIVNDNELIAYIFYSEYFDEININHFAVNPIYRRQGYATKLLNKLIETMENQLLYLEVNTENEAAINLYKKFGLEIIRTRRDYYGKDQDAYIMQKVF